MAFSKITLNGTTLMDVTQDTVNASKVLSGEYATGPDGVRFQGTMSPGGGGGADGEIVFIDYDGTVLHTYTKDEFLALSAMPSNPSHTGLTAQGWNWTLADAKAQVTAYPEAGLTIGQMYVTDDGKTKIHISLTEDTLHPYLTLQVNGTIIVDWGDGSATSTLTGSSSLDTPSTDHEYASAGDYVITLTVSSGSFQFYGNSNTSYLLRKGVNTSTYVHMCYTSRIKKIYVGTNAKFSDYAFNYCVSLETITIPSSSNITSINKNMFSYCYDLQSIVIPNTVTTINGSAFYNCYGLQRVSLHKNITSIGTYGFYYCFSLERITIPTSLTTLSDYIFQNCCTLEKVIIPNTITSIGLYAFNACYKLSKIVIPDSVTTINNYAFRNCSCLESIELPDITTIGMYVLADCRKLETVTIPSTVTSIDNYAFQNCYAIDNIVIPNKVTTIGNYAFSNCFNLKSITIPNNVISFGTNVFSECRNLDNITLPNTLSTISNSIFQNCYSLESITMPNTVQTIGTNSFSACNSLRNLTLSNILTSIDNYAFNACYSIRKLVIPSTVTNIGNYAFQGCYGVNEYYFLSTTPPTLGGTSVFYNIQSDCKIYVPYSADHSILTAYQSASNWSTHASKMVEMAP